MLFAGKERMLFGGKHEDDWGRIKVGVIPVFFRIIRYLTVVLVMLLVWAVFLMVYFDWFVPPFNLLIPFIMPWKMIFLTPGQTTLEGRLDFMQQLLDNSRIIASTSLLCCS